MHYALLRYKPHQDFGNKYMQSVSRIMLYTVGESKLTNHLVNRQAISYTLLEKCESCEDHPSFQELV